MKVKVVPSSWIISEAHRLDCSPFTSGGIEARRIIEKLDSDKQRLIELTKDGIAGMYHVGQEKLRRVESLEYGMPFLGSSDILNTVLYDEALISKEQVKNNRQFQSPISATLITRSGTIGRLVYARQEMEHVAISQDVLKVVPNATKVMPGYLYAFLSSRFGLPQIISGTFGSIIVHIEAENIADLLVPRLGKKFEQKVHDLVHNAADKRSQAAVCRTKIITRVEEALSWTRRSLASLWTSVRSGLLCRRMDGFHHSLVVEEARQTLANHGTARCLGNQVEEVFEPNRGARRKVEDERYGIPFLSSSEVFRLDPTGEYLVSKNTPHLSRLLLTDRDLLLPRSGQLGGIIGRAVLPLPRNYGSAASEHLVRVRCHSKEDAFYLWGIFASQPGYYATIATAFGSSIPSLDCELLSDLCVPWIEGSLRKAIVESAAAITQSLTEANESERHAIKLIEDRIGGEEKD